MKRTPLEQDKIRNFDKVIEIAKELGFKVSVTGGNYITHEINCSLSDYNEIYNLANGI
jgi:hypothetical protein